LELLVRPPILIPRPETEDWTIRLAQRIRPTPHRPIRVLDLCTGSGCIPLLLCRLWPAGSATALGVDLNPAAVQLASDNARHCGISTDPADFPRRNVFAAARGDIRAAAFAASLRGPFHLLTANPPYIPRREYDLLPSAVKDHEDPRALLGDQPLAPHREDDGKGLSFYRIISRLVSRPGFLHPGTTVALEIGHDQANEVTALMRDVGGLKDTEVWKDPWDIDRLVLGRTPS
jgi:release factor glutamine methyltransferase